MAYLSEEQKEEILIAANYDTMARYETKVLYSKEETYGETWHEVIQDTNYKRVVVRVTKNDSGPKFEHVDKAGTYSLHPEKSWWNVIQDFNTSTVGSQKSKGGVGVEAKATLVRVSAGPLNVHTGAGVSTEAGIVDDSAAVKIAGCGFKIGRKVEVSLFDNSIGIDFGKLLWWRR